MAGFDNNTLLQVRSALIPRKQMWNIVSFSKEDNDAEYSLIYQRKTTKRSDDCAFRISLFLSAYKCTDMSLHVPLNSEDRQIYTMYDFHMDFTTTSRLIFGFSIAVT